MIAAACTFFSLEANELEVLDQIKKADYIFCVDGGGTKTALQILNSKGQPLVLNKGEEESYLLQGDCSNVVVVGKERVGSVLKGLFAGLKVGPEKIKVDNILSKSVFIGGFAGAGREKPRREMIELVEALGFSPGNVSIYTDAGLAVELLGDSGAILIGGTGSICLVKEEGEVNRFGGLGYRIGDEGSGYDIGLRAIKASLQEEYEYGQQTSLTPLIKKLFNVECALDLMGPINSNKETPGKIASIAPLVFQEAWKGDEVAYQIVEMAANELGDLLARGVQNTEIRHCQTYLIGGLFQNKNTNTFLKLVCMSPLMQKLSKSSRPILINVSEQMVPTLVVQEKLRLSQGEEYQSLTSLPLVEGVVSNDYHSVYNKEFLTTEHHHSESKELSHTFHRDHLEGLKLMQKLDYSVIAGSEEFVDKYYEKVSQKLLKKIKGGGRVFLVGSGSSGRLAVDLAAKWKNYWKEGNSLTALEFENSVQAVIAGGARAFVKAKEKYEDSELFGYEALKELNLTSKDVVVLVSASGSANFNVGAGKAANDVKALCYYFHNSEVVPAKTENLFKNCNVKSICIDVGPQTISGSTRLQAASIGEFAWGMVLNEVLLNLTEEVNSVEKKRARKEVNSLKEAWDRVACQLPSIQEIVDMQIDVFSDEDSNFWKGYDETYQGYVTFLSSEDCLREIMVDTTETPPTFSSNPPRSIEERGKKKAEYRAYMVGSYLNGESWKKLMGRDIHPSELKDVSEILISMNEEGFGEYAGRTISCKNLILGVFSTSLESNKILSLALELTKAKDRGLKTAIIVLEDENSPLDTTLISYLDQMDVSVIIPDIPSDPLGVIRTLTLKQVLNLISNGAMIGMNKVYGNIMIDVRPSNNKLIDRSIRIIQEIHSGHHKGATYSYDVLFHYVTRALKYKELAELQLGKHVPSPAKLVLTMLEKQCDVEKSVALLKINNENIELILSDI